ncbi:fasciclin domain-containing protein [Chitinophaga sp. SYP-B3965]|uniref:fasciclin domain-containing protein n=1 Tax=Chitinophaga sp. SYP-B3965 TaxID=2663120 RepID=UPI0015634A39|nr:fasciclin domain-containing protein [Chitinophaga sp. SYP-B3965]
MKKIFRWPLVITLLVLLTQACKKDYYVDGGKADPHYNGTIYDYLSEKKLYFDTIKQIVDLAGLKDMMTSDTITFFAPTDEMIRVCMNDLNGDRYATMKDSVKISDIGAEVWRKFLGMYILKGKRTAGTFPRVSPDNINAFPGINYIMLDGYILNIGLDYTSYNGVEGVGPRILMVTDVTFDPTNFRNNPRVKVVSSDIQPKNGVVHALSINHSFGFRRGEFTRIASDYLK